MNHIKRVAVIGECMVELRRNNGVLEQGFGGDTLNTAVYLSRLTHEHGVASSYVTGLGRDAFSQQMLSAWQVEALDTEHVFISEDKLPGIYVIETAADGERSFFYWRNDSAAKYWLRGQEIPQLAHALRHHQMIYLSGISLAILPSDCCDALLELLRLLRAQGATIAFDNNYRPALWPSQQQAQSVYRQVLALTDIAFLTFDDEQALYGDETEQQAVDRTQTLGVKEIVIKRGAEPCMVVTQVGIESIASQPVEKIVDTTAAGDSFSAGYLAKRLLGGSTGESALAGHTLAGAVIQQRGALIGTDAMPTII
ncbi:sugar kinase [Vibrio vulnificus YJ016]|uniref:2-dehydro-3-deoxygluconokinase n=1 Tax=Vibrio vulnificus (strain YJ016) TaxID=196600 RepID=Q7MP10_VIBVY|nr:sugar kinase [Vibrio vulnificus]ELM6648794.1 sugar kinase [Vibrio vulnificus]MCG6285443.1 sugar kinase [Vibrio vulnificus]PWY34345.1 sugar kinase [Vibrio vulnificus]BAC93318.1 sugar kinase [Vibrio vulnificus YJ016]HAS6157767.1 sugar kinase [Vibrio vulnificus]